MTCLNAIKRGNNRGVTIAFTKLAIRYAIVFVHVTGYRPIASLNLYTYSDSTQAVMFG